MNRFTTYTDKNTYNSEFTIPSTAHVKGTGLANYYKDYLLKKVFGLYKFTLPKSWDGDFFRYALFTKGFIATFDEGERYGVIPQPCNLHGYNVFYRPTRAIITNPCIIKSRDLLIDKECTIIKLTPNYKGIWDIIDFYGDMLALCAASTSTNILNTRLAYVFMAKDKTAAESFKKMFDMIESGDPAVVIDKKLMNDDGSPAWQSFSQNIGQNFIAPQILECMETIEDKFDQTIGIPNANTDKRERLIKAEVESNNIDTRILADVIYDTIKSGIEKHNKMFPDYMMNIEYKYKNLGGELNE